jgi:hypothetical protein
VVTLRPPGEQEALDLLEVQYEQYRAQLGLQEYFESGATGDLTA